MGKTSTTVKDRYNEKTYKRYTVRIRKDEDAELIEYIEEKTKQISMAELFRTGIEKLKNEGF